MTTPVLKSTRYHHYYDRLILPDLMLERISDDFSDIFKRIKAQLDKIYQELTTGCYRGERPPLLLVEGRPDYALTVAIGHVLGDVYETVAVRTPSQDIIPTPRGYEGLFGPTKIEIYLVAINNREHCPTFTVGDKIAIVWPEDTGAWPRIVAWPPVVNDLRDVESPTLIAIAYGKERLEASFNYLRLFPQEYIPDWDESFSIDLSPDKTTCASNAVAVAFKPLIPLNVQDAIDAVKARAASCGISGILCYEDDLPDYLDSDLSIDAEIKNYYCCKDNIDAKACPPVSLAEKVENYCDRLKAELSL